MLECFGVSNSGPARGAIMFFEYGSPTLRRFSPSGFPLRTQPLTPRRLGPRNMVVNPRIEWKPLIHLRSMAVEHVQFAVAHFVNSNRDIRREWNRFAKRIFEIHGD